MTRKHSPNRQPIPRLTRLATAGAGALTLFAGASLGGCVQHAPKGQVVAVVDGKDITLQDLMAEARGMGAQGQQDRRLLTQRVVARTLLADAAHARKLDAYPGYPADAKRLQQTLLAQKVLATVVKPPAQPSPAAISAFTAAHPNVFSSRFRLKLDEIRFQGTSDLKEIQGADTLSDLETRLKALNGAPQRVTRVVDTAQLPPPLAERLVAQPDNKLFIVRERDAAVAIAILGREHVQGTPQEEQALATKLMQEADTQRQVEAEAARLRVAAKIAYQPGFEPPAPGAPPPKAPPTKAQ